MIEKYGFFDSLLEDPREYAEVDFARFGKVLGVDGVRGGEDALKVSAYASGLAIKVNPGMAMVQGRYYALEDDGSGSRIISLTTAKSNPRIDRIVLRLTHSTRTIGIGVLQGSEAAQPAAPALQRDSDVYMLSLAQIYIGVGVSSISSGRITDERADESVCGIVVVSPDAAMREAKAAASAAKTAKETADASAAAASNAQTTADYAKNKVDNLKVGVSGGVSGNLVSLDSSGNIADSGYPVKKLGTGAEYILSGSILYINTL